MVKVPFTLEKSQKKTSIKLPDYYTDIKPTNDGKPEPPQVESVASSSSNISYDDFECSTILTHYPIMIQMEDIHFQFFIPSRWKISKSTSKHNQLFYQFFLCLWIHPLW